MQYLYTSRIWKKKKKLSLVLNSVYVHSTPVSLSWQTPRRSRRSSSSNRQSGKAAVSPVASPFSHRVLHDWFCSPALSLGGCVRGWGGGVAHVYKQSLGRQTAKQEPFSCAWNNEIMKAGQTKRMRFFCWILLFHLGTSVLVRWEKIQFPRRVWRSRQVLFLWHP